MTTHRILAPALLGLLTWGVAGAQAYATQPVALNIEAQPVRAALQQFGEQAGLQVLMRLSGDEADNVKISPVKGEFTAKEGLERLLARTGLQYEFVNERTVRVAQAEEGAKESPEGMKRVGEGGSPKSPETHAPAVGKDSSVESNKQNNNESTTSSAEDESKVAEIVVTAQKRVERLQDVPVPVTAIAADTLVNSNQLRLQDYYTKVPGLNLTMLGSVGTPLISIRGLTTGGYANPTVGIVVDDIPFGSSSYLANGSAGAIASDLDPSELSRIEVLRGPQGTLYGASSLGGLLKYVTADPSTDRLSGRLQVGTTSVHRGDELGYGVRGAVNVPLSDTLAMSLSGSTRRDPGYIDNLQSGQDDVNRVDSESGRFAVLWRPTDDFSVKLSALYQHTERGGTSDTHLPSPVGPVAGLGDLQQSALINTGKAEQKYQAYSATMTAKVGNAELTSLTGYSLSNLTENVDFTPFFGTRSQAQFGVGGFLAESHGEISKFTQELRLSTPIGNTIQWLLGGFYTDENYPTHSFYLATSPATGAVAGTWFTFDNPGSYSEYAAFTNMTFLVTERFDVQVGARASRNSFSSGPYSGTGLYNTVIAGGPSLTTGAPKFSAKDDSFTYLLTPRLRISPDLMAYARLASGYRPGGFNTTNAVLLEAAGLPTEYAHDSTRNYEIGIKGAAFGGAFSFDASLYYIDWKDVQLQLRSPTNIFLTYTLNAGGARSQGAELSVELRPTEALTISAWGAYTNPELTSVPTNSNLTARAGDTLPYSPKLSGNISIDQRFPLWGSASGFVGSSLSYVGERKGRFFTGVPQGIFPAYTQWDLRAGASLDSWTINAFVNNVADKRGILRGGRDANLSFQYVTTYTQPRTLGLSLTKTF